MTILLPILSTASAVFAGFSLFEDAEGPPKIKSANIL